MLEIATACVFIFLAVFVSVHVSILLHELGHVLFGRLVGAVPTSCGMGKGKMLFVHSIWGTRFYLGSRRLGSGLTFSLFPQLLPGRWQMTAFMAGGIIINCILAALAYAAVVHWPISALTPVGYIFGGINLFLVLRGAVPLRLQVGPVVSTSDGYRILLSWLGRPLSSPGDAFRTLESVAPLLREVGDLHHLRACIVQAAEFWCGLGDAIRAGELLEEARAIPIDPLPPFRSYETLVRASVASAAGDQEKAEILCREAQQEFLRLNHHNGVLLSAIAMGWLILWRGDPVEIRSYYQRAEPMLSARQGRRPGSASCTRLLACLRAFSEGTDADGFVVAYEAMPAYLRSPFQDLQVYRFAAISFARAAGPDKAAAAYVRALAAITVLDRTFAAADRERFRLAQLGLITETQAVLRSIGRSEEALRLNTFLPSPAEIAQREREAGERRERFWNRLLRLGPALVLFNIGAIASSLVIAYVVNTVAPERVGRAEGSGLLFLIDHLDTLLSFPVAFLVMWLTVFTGFAVAFAMPLRAVSRWLPVLRHPAAFFVLLFSIVPWIVGPALGIAIAASAQLQKTDTRPSRSGQPQVPHQFRRQ